MKISIIGKKIRLWEYRQVSFMLAIATVSAGLAVLAGWFLDLSFLKGISTTFISMQANTAVGFILSGLSLLLFHFGARWPQATKWSRLFALSTMILGGATLYQYLFSTNLGIDEFFLKESPGTLGSNFPGRMSPLSAINFILAGGALIMAEIRRFRRLQAISNGLLGLFGLLIFVAYLYGEVWRAGIAQYGQMAIQTAALFTLLSVGIFCLSPSESFIKTVQDNTSGAWLLKRLLPGMVAVFISLGWLWSLSEKHKFFEDSLGAALLVVGLIIFMTALIIWIVRSLDQLQTRHLLSETAASEKFKAIADYTVGWESWFGPDGKYLWVNPGVERVTGYTHQEILAMPDFISTVIAEEDRLAVRNHFQDARKGGRGDNFELRFVKKNGDKAWLNVSYQPLYGDTGVFLGLRISGQDITLRKQVEREIKEARDQFELMFQASPDGTLITTFDGQITNFNESFMVFTGYSRQELLGKSAFAVSLWDNPEIFKLFIQEIKAKGYSKNFECIFRHKDGTARFGLMSGKLITLQGQPHVFSITRDIGERVQAEKIVNLLADTQMRFLQLQEPEEAFKLTGEKIHEMIGDGYVAVTLSDKKKQATNVVNIFGIENILKQLTSLFGFDPTQVDYPVSEIPEKVFASYRNSKLECCEGGMHEVLLHKVPKAICLATETIFGIKRVYTIGCTWDDLNFGGVIIFAKHDLADLAAAIEMLVSQALISIHRLWVEKELRLRNIMLIAQQEAAIDGILVVNENDEIISVNRRFLEMWHIPPEIARLNNDDHILPLVADQVANVGEFLEKVKALYASRTQTSQDELQLKDGRIFDRYSSPMRDDHGFYYGRVWYFHDITQRRILFEQLFQAQKMESVGRLAAGIAHEINTPAQYVGDNVHFLQDAFQTVLDLLGEYDRVFETQGSQVLSPETHALLQAQIKNADIAYLRDEIPKAFQQTIDGIERISTIVRAMKEFAHPGKVEMAMVDLNHAIESTLIVARNEFKYMADLVLQLDPELPNVPCLLNEFNQVILNLVVNAAQAIAETLTPADTGKLQPKGTITVATQRQGEWVQISISDTGCGIPENIQSKIFDPFFTTKVVGKGTGQGLAISRSIIVEKHQGRIEVTSKLGQGTTFFIHLPLVMAKAVAEV